MDAGRVAVRTQKSDTASLLHFCFVTCSTGCNITQLKKVEANYWAMWINLLTTGHWHLDHHWDLPPVQSKYTSTWQSWRPLFVSPTSATAPPRLTTFNAATAAAARSPSSNISSYCVSLSLSACPWERISGHSHLSTYICVKFFKWIKENPFSETCSCNLSTLLGCWE